MGRISNFLLGIPNPEPVADHAIASVVLEGGNFVTSRSGIAEALGVAAVFRARQLNADVLGSLPVRLRTSGDTPPPPNPEQDWGDLISEAVLSMQDCGLAPLYRDSAGSLWVLDASDVSVSTTDNKLRRQWRWRNVPMRSRGIAANLFPVTMNATKANPGGVGWLESSRITGVLAAQAYAEDYFANNAKPGGYLRVPGTLDDAETDELLASWIAAQQERRPAAISTGIEWVDSSFSPNDSQWVETHRMSTGDVALLAGLPGTLLDYNTPGSSITYQNLGDVHEQTWRSTWYPYYVRRLESTISRAIRSEVWLDPERLFLASLSARAQAARSLVSVGYEPDSVSDQVGLDGLRHTGQIPTTVYDEEARN